MRWALGIFGIILLVATMRFVSTTSMRELFHAEVSAALEPPAPRDARAITDQDLAQLPEPVAKFLRASGFVGKPHTTNARIRWQEMLLKTAHDRPWMKVACDQLNVAAQPTRIALMRGRLAGVVPFEGRDKYQNGHGNMLIRAGRLFTVVDSSGREMDESALATVLAEVLMIPSLALGERVRWEAIDARTARGTLTDAGISVSGTFHFDEAGDMVRFDTNDRWQDGKPPRKLPWSAHVGGYRFQDGIKVPTAIGATWHEPGGDFTYARGTIAGIDYNVRTFHD